jgi:hypothetical protein
MHRFSWDMKYQPLGEGGGGRGGGGAGGAVPHRTYPSVAAPWAVPGSYKVRLTANGKTYAQPLELHLDPRVNAQSLGVQTNLRLTKEMYEDARQAHAAAEEARALTAKLESAQGAQADALKKQLASALTPPPAPAGRGRGSAGGGGVTGTIVQGPIPPAGGSVPAGAPPAGRGGGRGGRGGGRGGGAQAAGSNGLDQVSAQLMAAAMAMQAADAAPTAREVAACAEARRQFTAIMVKWNAVKTQGAALK